MITFDIPLAQLLTLVSGAVLPLVVGLISTRVTSSGAKAVLLLALAGIDGLLGEIIDALTNDVIYNLGQALISAATVFLIGVATHFGVYKPLGVSRVLQGKGRTA